MTYSLDFRKKVLAIKEQEGLTGKETAVRFGIGEASITRWNNCLEAQSTRNKPATKIDMEALERDIKENPDAYQYERAARLGVCQRAVGYALERLNISRKKKTLSHPKADEEARQHFQQKIEAYEADNKAIVYLDESGFADDMPRVPTATHLLGNAVLANTIGTLKGVSMSSVLC